MFVIYLSISKGSRVIANAKPNILLLDDDSAFLDVAFYFFEHKFGDSAFISACDNSGTFMENIQEKYYIHDSPQDILRTFYQSKKTEKDIEQTLNDLSYLPAFLVIDHQLRKEDTNGIEISNKVREYVPSSYVILLTSFVDSNTALELHNNDTIDLFVRKDDVYPMDIVYRHLKMQIEKRTNEFYINPEDAFRFGTILENESYISKRKELLDDILYLSYITTSCDGDIAVLTRKHIEHYKYKNGMFTLNG